jgi:branched-chain amino acid transport system substrate-binding protein
MLRSLPFAPSLLLAAGLALFVAACGPRTASRPEVAAVPVPQPTAPTPLPGRVDPNRPVLVAVLAPLTSSDAGAAAIGKALENAARMAAVDLADPTMELRFYDTAGDPARARQAAAQAVGEGAALILGPLFSASAGEVGDAVAGAGINVISFSTDSTVAGGPVFVSGFLPEAEARRVVGYAASQGYGRLAVFYPQTDYGAAARRGAEAAARSNGARVVAATGYPRTFKGIQNTAGDFTDAALAAGATAVLLPDGGQGLRSAAAFVDYAGLDPARTKYLGLGQWSATDARQEAALRGGWVPAPEPDRFETFANLYAARYGAPPPFIAVLGYDAVQVAGQLLAEARRLGSQTAFGRAELTRIDGFQGALGPLRFEPDGTSLRALAILEAGPEGFEVLDPAPYRLDTGS